MLEDAEGSARSGQDGFAMPLTVVGCMSPSLTVSLPVS